MAENQIMGQHQQHIPVEPMELGDNEADATIADDQLPIVDPAMATNAADALAVVDSAPIDIEQICAQYTGYALMQRLLFIADHCPLLKRDALVALVHYIQQVMFDFDLSITIILFSTLTMSPYINRR